MSTGFAAQAGSCSTAARAAICATTRASCIERVGAPFSEIDITTDDALHAAYLERIPVVVLDGDELFEYFVDEGALRSDWQRTWWIE